MTTEAPSMPPSPSSKDKQHEGSDWKPHEYNPDMASAKLAETMMEKMPPPGIVSKPFVVWLGIFRGLNHTKDNHTYFDANLFVSIFEGVSHDSVNINGALFEKFWQYMMKPKMIIQGVPGQATFTEGEEKESLWERVAPTWLGGKPAGGEKNDKPS